MKFFVENYKLIAFLLRWARNIPRARAIFSLVLLSGALAGVANTALIAIINASWGGAGRADASLVLWFAALCVLLPVSRLVSQVLLMRLTTGAMYEMRMQLCRKILRAPLRLLEELGPHRLLATLTDDVPSISGVLGSLPILCMHLAIVLSCLAYLYYLSPIAFAGVLFFLVLGVVTYQLPLLKAVNYIRRSRERGDDLFKGLRALTEGTKELKLHRERREAFLSDHLSSVIKDLQHNSIRGNTIYMAAASWGHILFFVLIGLIIFALPGYQATDFKVLSGYTLTLIYMMTPLEVILNTLPSLGRAHAAVRKVESLGLSLSEQSAEADSAGGVARRAESWESIELVGVTQEYGREGIEDSFTLGPVDLSLRPGELVFLVGGNGSGKTTLAKVVVGLYTPQGGEIRLDGQPVTDRDRDEYRQLFSVVFSDFYLFESLLGLDAASLDTRARAYLSKLQLEQKVSVKDGALSTVDLSQGQRKRLALLTAYLEDRLVYVFDEWAADQDPLFKEVFYFQLLPELKAKGKTVIVITHDDRYFHLADRIVKLDYGKIEYDRAPGDARVAAELLDTPLVPWPEARQDDATPPPPVRTLS